MNSANDVKAAEDPIAYFLEDMEYHGKSERTISAYDRVLRQFEAHLETKADTAVSPDEAGQRDCLSWVHSIREDVSSSTVATYASYLHRFYAYMAQIGVFDANPMAIVREELDESIETDPIRRDISLGRMREFVETVTHPLDRAIIVTFLKTGIRVGELCNLDLRDVKLADSGLMNIFDMGGRTPLDGHPGSLFVAPDVERGSVANGERRVATNKRQRSTTIPVDEELEEALHRWLTIRPDTRSPAEPLFLSTRDAWGKRVTPEMVRGMTRNHAASAGWYRSGGDATENVTPHYFRHFFTTHLRDRTGDRGVVKYLRGDVADDVIDTYTHQWGDRVREVYEENIYSLF